MKQLQEPSNLSINPKISHSASKLDKERRWNEICISQKQKLYAKKHNLQPKNVYQNLFSFINEKIRHKIEINENRLKYNIETKDEFFVVKRYSQMYDSSSKEVLKMFKSQQSNFIKPSLNTVNCIQIVKELDFKKLAKKKNTQKTALPVSKVYKMNSVSKLDEKCSLLTQKLRSQSINLQRRLSRDENKQLEPLSTFDKQLPKSLSKKYTKNAYLASLNYDFKNPLF